MSICRSVFCLCDTSSLFSCILYLADRLLTASPIMSLPTSLAELTDLVDFNQRSLLSRLHREWPSLPSRSLLTAQQSRPRPSPSTRPFGSKFLVVLGLVTGWMLTIALSTALSPGEVRPRACHPRPCTPSNAHRQNTAPSSSPASSAATARQHATPLPRPSSASASSATSSTSAPCVTSRRIPHSRDRLSTTPPMLFWLSATSSSSRLHGSWALRAPSWVTTLASSWTAL